MPSRCGDSIRNLPNVLRRLAVGPRYELEEVAVGVVEVEATAAIEVVDLAAPVVVEIGVEGDAAGLEAREGGVELGLAHQEGAVLGTDIVGIGVVERHPVA